MESDTTVYILYDSIYGELISRQIQSMVLKLRLVVSFS